MLDKIYEFAKENCGEIKSVDFKQKKIGGYICIDANGEYQRFEVIENPTLSSFPAIGNTGGSMTNIIIEKTDIVLGLHDSEKREEYYINKVNECRSHSLKLTPLTLFIKNTRENKDIATAIQEQIKSIKVKNDLISFKINNEAIETDNDIINAMLKVIPKSDKSEIGMSSISNKEKELCDESVKFKFKTAGYDTPIAPFSKSRSAESYFQSGMLISRIGKDEVDIIKTGFEKLLNDEKHYNSFFKLIHWYSEELNDIQVKDDIFDFVSFSNLEHENVIDENNDKTKNEHQEATQVLDAITKIDSSNIGNIDDNIYHIAFCYAPCDSRYRLYGYREWNVRNALNNLKKFKNDATIHTLSGEIQTIDNLRSYLWYFVPAGTKETEKYIKNTFGSNIDRLIYSVYDNTQIPTIFYKTAIDIATHFVAIDSNKKEDKRYNYKNYLNAIKTIKLYKTRKEDNMQNKNAYQCGRVFAVYERLQEKATDGTSVANMFGMAKQYPSRVINKISTLSKHHLNSSKIKNTGSEFYFKKMLDELYDDIDTIPAKLNLDEQADFILGYHHQKNILNSKKEKETNDNE